MNAILAIALNTFKEAVRNRILYVLLFFALLILSGAWVASTLSLTAPDKVIRDLGVGAVNIISVLMAVFVGVGLVYNDLDKKTIYTIIPKPVSRWQFIVGKYLGLLGTIVVNILVMTFFFIGVLYFRQYMDEEAMKKALMVQADGSMKSPSGVALLVYTVKSAVLASGRSIGTIVSLGAYHDAITNGVMAATVLTILEMMLVTAFAILFSTFSSPTLSLFLTVAMFLIGRLNPDLYDFANSMIQKTGSYDLLTTGQKVGYQFGVWASYLSPNLDMFNQRMGIADMKAVAVDPMVAAYGLVYTTLVLTVAVMVFNRRNFK